MRLPGSCACTAALALALLGAPLALLLNKSSPAPAARAEKAQTGERQAQMTDPLKRGARVVVFLAGNAYDARAGTVVGFKSKRVIVALDRLPPETKRRRRSLPERYLRRLSVRPTGNPAAAPALSAWRTVSSPAELQKAVGEAPRNANIELRGGSYPALTLDQTRTTWVTIRPAVGEQVTLADLDFGPRAAYIRVEGVTIDSQVLITAEGAGHIQLVGSRAQGVRAEWGSHDLLIEGNLIERSDSGVELISTNCSVHNAPESCSGDRTLAPVERVTIRNNRIVAPLENGITVANFRAVLIEGNEITGLSENGQHSDALQSLWGGDGLVFRRNYVHDMEGNQGFFIKDGRVSNVTVDNNLIVRTRPRVGYNFAGSPLSFYDTVPDPAQPYFTGYGIVLSRNTIWDNAHFLVISGPDNRKISIRNNVTEAIAIEGIGKDALRANGIDQGYNIVRDAISWGRAGPHDTGQAPRFRDAAKNDYRITTTQRDQLKFRAGVSWLP